MEDPGFLVAEFQDMFVAKFEFSQLKIGKTAERLIMIAGDVEDISPLGCERNQLFDNL